MSVRSSVMFMTKVLSSTASMVIHTHATNPPHTYSHKYTGTQMLLDCLTGTHSHTHFTRMRGITSRILPLRRSRSPVCLLLRTPVTIVTRPSSSSDSPGLHHLPEYLPDNCHSLWFFPQVLLFMFLCFMSLHYSCFLFCSMFVFY